MNSEIRQNYAQFLLRARAPLCLPECSPLLAVRLPSCGLLGDIQDTQDPLLCRVVVFLGLFTSSSSHPLVSYLLPTNYFSSTTSPHRRDPGAGGGETGGAGGADRTAIELRCRRAAVMAVGEELALLWQRGGGNGVGGGSGVWGEAADAHLHRVLKAPPL
jgi:hypothetical protein